MLSLTFRCVIQRLCSVFVREQSPTLSLSFVVCDSTATVFSLREQPRPLSFCCVISCGRCHM